MSNRLYIVTAEPQAETTGIHGPGCKCVPITPAELNVVTMSIMDVLEVIVNQVHEVRQRMGIVGDTAAPELRISII